MQERVEIVPPQMDTSQFHRKWLDVAYASQSPTQKLDIYLPQNGEGPFPVIAAFHGGAWLFGDKGDVQHFPMLKGLARGFAVVCINYRLSGEAIFPAQIYDCKAAIRFLKANAAKYQLDPERIGAWGGSAGAHLVSLLGTSAKVKELEDLSMGNAEFSSEVQAVVDWCGPNENFLKMDEEFLQSGLGIADHSGPDSPESKLLGRHIVEVPELVKFASPMSYIHPNVPPFLIQHGALDQVVPTEQSIHFATELERIAGSEKVTLEVIHGLHHHGDPAFESDQIVERVFEFLSDHLNP